MSPIGKSCLGAVAGRLIVHIALYRFNTIPEFTSTIISIVLSYILTSTGVFQLMRGGSSLFTISIVVPTFVLLGLKKELAFYRSPRKQKMSWWYKHMECMLGCGAAFHTAGLLLTFRWLEFELPGYWRFVPWVLPSIVAGLASHFWIKAYRQKFGDAAELNSEEARPLSATKS